MTNEENVAVGAVIGLELTGFGSFVLIVKFQWTESVDESHNDGRIKESTGQF